MRYPALAASFLALATFTLPGAAFATAVPAVSSLTATFTNPTPFAIADNDESSSLIEVSGLAGNITGLTLTIAGLNHTYSADLVIGLRSLDLDTGIIVMSQVGTYNDIVDATLTFSDFAATGLTSGDPVVSGTYLPSNRGLYEFVDGVTVDSFAGFNGLDPNGTWELLIADISAGDSGLVTGGFSLAFTTDATGAVPEPASWAAMIAGFGLIGGAMRRRPAMRAIA